MSAAHAAAENRHTQGDSPPSAGSRRDPGARVARGSLSVLGASALAAVAQTASLALLARWLPAEAFGAFALLQLVAQIAGAAAQLGLGSALVQAKRIEPDDARAVLGLAWLQGLALAASVALASPVLATVLATPLLARLLPVFALTLLAGPPAGVALALLQRRLAFGRVAAFQLASLAVGIASTFVAVGLGAGVWALVVGRLAADAALLAAALASLGALARPRLALRRARAFVSFGARVAGTQLLNATAGQLDTALLGVSLGAAALGHYSMASSLVMLPAARLAGVVKGVAFAALARAERVGGDFEGAASLLLLHVGVACAAPVVGLALVAQELVPLVLGAAWQDTATLIVALAPAGLVYAWGSAMGAILLARGAAQIELRFALLRLVALGPLIYLGTAAAGARGAALAVSLYAILCLPLFFWVLARWGGLRPARVARALAPGLVCALAMGPLVLGVGVLCDAAGALARLCAEIVAGAAAFFVCLRLAFPLDFRVLATSARRALPTHGDAAQCPPPAAAALRP